MKEGTILILKGILSLLKKFTKTVTHDKPFLSLLFPVSGFGTPSIPNTIITGDKADVLLEFINAATPYLKFLFLILTTLLTIVSFILQVKKIMNNNNKDERT